MNYDPNDLWSEVEKFDYTREPDPNERYVLACMREGLTHAEIDKKRHWWSGTTIRILTERWARENEQED